MSIDQQQRADAYHRNLIAMIFFARCDLTAHVRDHGESIETAMLRNRLRTLVNTVDEVEAGNYHPLCEACSQPLIDGQLVIIYDDVGSVHANCDEPSQASIDPPSFPYESGYSPEECAAELEKARAVLAADEVDV